MPDTRDDPFFRPEPDPNAQNPAPQTEPTTQFPPIPPQYQTPQYPPTQFQPSQYQPAQYETPQQQQTPQYEQPAPVTGAPTYPGAAPYPGAPSYPGGPSYPGAPAFYTEPPKKKRRVGLIVGICVAAVLVVCGGATAGILVASNHKSDDTTTTASTPTSGASTPVTTPSSSATDDGPIHSGSLVKFLIPAPSSSHADRHPLGSHNAFTAKQDAAQWQDGKEWRLGMLTTHDFKNGAVRQWVQPNTLVEVQLYGFPAANNARGFVEDDTADTDYYDKPTTEKSVSNVAGGQVYYTKAKDKEKNTHAFAVARCGNVALEVWVDTYGTVSLTLVDGLLYKQYKKLCP
jgi:hypothetical protein